MTRLSLGLWPASFPPTWFGTHSIWYHSTHFRALWYISLEGLIGWEEDRVHSATRCQSWMITTIQKWCVDWCWEHNFASAASAVAVGLINIWTQDPVSRDMLAHFFDSKFLSDVYQCVLSPFSLHFSRSPQQSVSIWSPLGSSSRLLMVETSLTNALFSIANVQCLHMWFAICLTNDQTCSILWLVEAWDCCKTVS